MPVRKASFGLCVVLVCSIFYLVLHGVTNSINNVVKQPYMDEIFHIPQAQRYCQGNYSYYDPKITTPPGLYVVSYLRIWLRDVVLLRKSELICDTLDLRKTNHLIAIFNFVTLVLIQLSSANGRANDLGRNRIGLRQRITYNLDQSTAQNLAKIILKSIAITILPPLFFFNSLYYTDAGSLLFTLLAYLFSISNRHSLAAIVGIISICFRQTNIVWLFYAACLVILRTLDELEQKKSETKKKQPIRQQARATTPANCFMDYLYKLPFSIELVKRCTPYALVGISFIMFVFMNKGIVLGDKDAHQPKLHLAQIVYFLGFCAVFGSGWIFQLRIVKRFLYFTLRSPLTAMIATVLIISLISFGRYAHPYLLADNRHLTFYIWRRILDRHNSYVPYLLTPVYLLASLSVWHHLRVRGCKRMLLFIFCTLLAIVPNGLLEPRYFIIPYIFLRLSIESTILELIFEILHHWAINMSMHYLFLYKTFQWADSSEVQRIMW